MGWTTATAAGGRLSGSLGAGSPVEGPAAALPPGRPDAARGHEVGFARWAARARVLAALLVTLAVPLVPAPPGRRLAALALAGAVWLTAAGWALLRAERPDADPEAAWPTAVDLVCVAALGVLLPGPVLATALADLVIIGAFAYLAGRQAALRASLAAMGLLVGTQPLLQEVDRLDPATILLVGPSLAVVAVVLDQATLGRRAATAQLAQAHEAAAVILEKVASGVVVTDAAGRITTCNPAAARSVARPAVELVGRTCGEVLGLHVGERPLDCSQGCALLALSAADRVGSGVEAWRPAEAGAEGVVRRQPFLASAAAVHGPGGEVVEVVHSLRDVTSLKQADEAKTLFLATASHELKTPLTVIRGFAQTLLDVPDLREEVRLQALEAIARRSLELSRIVDRLLLSSRIDAGRVHVDLVEVELGPVLAERAGSLGAATSREVTLEVEPGLPAVAADPEAIATVVDHLLDNAVKYSPDGGPVSVEVRARDERWVEVAIGDAGVGMDEEQAARCFERFWQAESTEGRRFGGTGIGLYIVRSLVEAMGGEVGVASAPGVGTTLTVSLLQAGALGRDEPTAPAAPDEGAPEPSIVREFMRQLGIPTEVAR